MTTHVLLVNEIRLMCNMIAAVIEDEPDIEVVGVATSIEEALKIVRRGDVDVALVSTKLGGRDALELTNTITQIAPGTKVLALGLTEKRERVLRYVEAGAVGYILPDDSLDEMLDTIRAADSGQAFVSPEIAAAMMERITELAQMFAQVDSSDVKTAGLTPRELEVLELIAQDMTNPEIAERLVIEVGTVKNHVHNILDKLNVNSRGDAAAYLAFIHSQR
ncbi:MAG: response regulator transcription factor [Anaerolineales bacterium]|jgi:DNA-binding NarL/FixJ family response regulator